MTRRSKVPWFKVECLENHPRDPLVWLGQYAAADRRGDCEVAKELHRQLAQVGYAVARADTALPAGTLQATLTLADGTSYRLVQLERAEVQRLMSEMGMAQGRSTP